MTITRVTPIRNEKGQIRFFRYGSVVTNWEVKHEIPGRLRIKNPVIHRKSDLCQAIERELMSVLGIDSYKTNPLTSTVLVQYDPKELTPRPDHRDHRRRLGHSRASRRRRTGPTCICRSARSRCRWRPRPSSPRRGCCPWPRACSLTPRSPPSRTPAQVLVEEKRLGVDVLDAIVVLGCLGTMSIFPGAVLCWCLSFGRVLVKKTQDNSKKLLLNAFGKQPRFVWLYRDGVEVQVALDRLQAGDIIVVNTGEVVAVDGIIAEGLAMIDQHALTGESTPAEKGVGDRVFASTLLVAGKILVSVEKSGSETASAKISQILNDTAGYKLSSQHKGEVLADKAVIPTLTIGAVGLATMGPFGAVAVLNSDFGTGIRMAAPLAMLSSLALCASKGILVKDGRALELMNEVDTVLFDKTGTLTRERPEVGRVIASPGSYPRGNPPLTRPRPRRSSIIPSPWPSCTRPRSLNLDLPTTDDTQYKVGYGITVQHPRTHDPGWQQAVHGARRPADEPGSQGRPGRGSRRRAYDGDGGGG